MVKVYYNQFKRPMKSSNTHRPTRYGPPPQDKNISFSRPTHMKKLTGEALRQQRLQQKQERERKQVAEEQEAKEVGVDVDTLRRLKLRGFKHKSIAEVKEEQRQKTIKGLKEAGGVTDENIRALAQERRFQRSHPHNKPPRDDIRHSMKNIGENIKKHPVQTAILGGSIVLGLGATLLSGGILGPEAAETILTESQMLAEESELGAASQIEMVDLSKSALNTSLKAEKGAADFIDVSQVSKLPKSQLAVGTENIESEMNVINDFKSVEVGNVEPEIPQWVKAQRIAKQVAEDEEVILDGGKVPTKFSQIANQVEEEEELIERVVQLEPEPVKAPQAVNPEADAVKNSGAIENSSQAVKQEEEMFWQKVNLDEAPKPSAAEIDEIEEMVEIGINNKAVARAALDKLSKYGSRGIKFMVDNQKKTMALLTAVGAAPSVIASIQQIAQAKTMKGKIEAFGQTIEGLNDIHKGITGKDHEILVETKKVIEDVNKGIEELEKHTEELKTESERIFDETKKVLNVDKQIKEEIIKGDKKISEQLKEIIKDNRAETEAIKHNEVKLDSDLQELQQEEKKEIDNLEAIKNVIDRPQTPADFLLALKNYETEEGKFDFLSEHYDTLITFDNKSIQQILSIFN